MPAFWQARERAVQAAAQRLYSQHLEADPNNVETLASLFHSLPVHSPVQPQHFGLTQEDVFRHDLQLWRRRAAASNDYSGTIVDISNSP